MGTNELRIGNYVGYGINFDKSQSITTIKGIEESKVLLHTDLICLLEQIKPIPITEELLLKCGFRNYSANILVLDKKYYYNKSTKTIFIGQEPIFEIEYLHTLQNFFALTNQELKIIL